MDTPTILRTSAMLGLSGSIWLSGIYFSSSQLTLPILYRFPAAVSADIFDEFYHRGIPTIVPLTAFSAISYGVASYLDTNRRVGYAVAGVLTLASLPWTILVMMKTIQTLLDISKDAAVREKMGQETTVELLKSWKWMNFVRSALALAGGFTGLLVFAGEV